MIFSIGSEPHTCESTDTFRLSPSTKMAPAGTVVSGSEYVGASSAYGS